MWQPGRSGDKLPAVFGQKEVTRGGSTVSPSWLDLPGRAAPQLRGALGHITALNNKGVVPCFSLGKKRRMKKAKISKTKNSKKKIINGFWV